MYTGEIWIGDTRWSRSSRQRNRETMENFRGQVFYKVLATHYWYGHYWYSRGGLRGFDGVSRRERRILRSGDVNPATLQALKRNFPPYNRRIELPFDHNRYPLFGEFHPIGSLFLATVLAREYRRVSSNKLPAWLKKLDSQWHRYLVN